MTLEFLHAGLNPADQSKEITMSIRTTATHRITLNAPIALCMKFFTPAGEELWVEGWAPRYLVPHDGSTEQGMVFTTGKDDDFTIWNLVDWNIETHYARYSRVTPAFRTGFVEIQCQKLDETTTAVEVTYRLTALTPAGETTLANFEGDAYRAMINSWKQAIDAALPRLLTTPIR